ncbi:hypothetical protein U9M48_010094 [Paspalum notatum var. saurae]|uniref:Uncharacterized protein n=1 Tax=Paspalum notatum var. saurae TaxID=547442 RepID=A0AAQ3WFS0_PASNO
MPNPPKERPSGRLGRLLAALRPSRAGPLPVQTGFPTSLADLVVKNHGRLKKQPSSSSKRGKRGAAASPSPSPSPSPPPPPPPPAAAVWLSDRPRPDDLPPARLAPRVKGGGFGLGLGFLAAVGVVSLALLVIWSKKVVATVTVASFLLFLLESVRSRPLPRPVVPVPERRLYLDGRGRVSPIRELEPEPESPRPSCSDSDRGSEASVLAAEDTSGALDEPSNPKAKAKKRPWKKLIAGAKRLHNKGRKSSNGADPPGVSFRGSEGDEAGDATLRGGNARAADPSASLRRRTGAAAAAEDAVFFAKEPDSARGSRRIHGVELGAALPAAVEIDASVDVIEEEEEEDEERGRAQAGVRFPALALVAVALVGLVAGKAPAVALTVLCYAFCGSAQRLASGGGGGPGRRLVEVFVS